MNRKAVRIIALVLAALMAVGVFSVLINVFL